MTAIGTWHNIQKCSCFSPCEADRPGKTVPC